MKLMAKLITVERAEKEIARLQEYVNLVESYKVDSLESWIIKEYAYTNSMLEVVKRAEAEGKNKDGSPIDKLYVSTVLNGRPNDKLHRLLLSGYKQKIKPNKKTY